MNSFEKMIENLKKVENLIPLYEEGSADLEAAESLVKGLKKRIENAYPNEYTQYISEKSRRSYAGNTGRSYAGNTGRSRHF